MKVYRWCGLVQPFLCVFVNNISPRKWQSPLTILYLKDQQNIIQILPFWMFMQLCTIIKEVITIFVFRHCIYESFGKCFERVLGYWAGLINNRFQQYASIQMGRTNAKNSRSLKPTLALLNSVSYSL